MWTRTKETLHGLRLFGLGFDVLFFAFPVETFSVDPAAPAPSCGLLDFAFVFTALEDPEVLGAPAFGDLPAPGPTGPAESTAAVMMPFRPERDSASNSASRRYPASFAA